MKLITQTIASFPEVNKALFFGSRSLGNAKKGSDVDIALYGKKVTIDIQNKIRSILNEELPIPYHFDVLAYNHIENKDLKKHIKKYGKTFYKTL